MTIHHFLGFDTNLILAQRIKPAEGYNQNLKVNRQSIMISKKRAEHHEQWK